MKTIDKKSVFICSTGRTGTQFFGNVLQNVIQNSKSVHEPDTFWITRPGEFPKKVKDFGLYHMTIGQLTCAHMYKLSSNRLRATLLDEQVMEYIYKSRNEYVRSIKEELYIESSGHNYGILDLIDEVFPNSKFIFIIRDPRTWIMSALNTLEYLLYGKFDFQWLKLSMYGSDFPNDPYYYKWDKMNKFEKYCWFYNKLNTIVLEKMQHKPNFKLFRFEDLFYASNRKDNFKKLIDYTLDFQEPSSITYTFKESLLDHKIHSKAYKYSGWYDWNNEKIQLMNEHCGNIMNRFGYGYEHDWIKRSRKKTSGKAV